MFVSDPLLYLILLVVAIFFTIMTFLPNDEDFEKELSEDGFHTSLLPAVIRLVAFPIFSAASWSILSILSLTLNNCAQSFAQCYTSPTFLTVGVAISNPFGSIISVLFMVFAVVTAIMSAAIIFSITGAILTARRNARQGGIKYE